MEVSEGDFEKNFWCEIRGELEVTVHSIKNHFEIGDSWSPELVFEFDEGPRNSEVFLLSVKVFNYEEAFKFLDKARKIKGIEEVISGRSEEIGPEKFMKETEDFCYLGMPEKIKKRIESMGDQ